MGHNHKGQMGKRGVSRPMAMHDKGHDMGRPYSESRQMMMVQHHRQTLWVYWSIVMFGFWLIFSPLTFGYSVGLVEPSGGREIWLDLASRIQAMTISDIASGFVLVILGLRALKADRPIGLWTCCFIGVWLNVAPLLFWAPTAVSYYNDTLVGTFIIALTILIPGMPNMINYMEMGKSLPPGWSYNPSSWAQRWIMIVLGLAGWFVSRYLAAYQMGYIESAWDPFFGESTTLVLNSDMSHGLPISDAGLGALAYTFEFLMGFMGSPARWRTMPWMVTLFGILVIPLGLVHIFLVISQPVVVGHWCTLCLLAAGIMLPMIPLEVDEVIAMMQFMKRRIRKGESFWKVFWKGGADDKEDQTDIEISTTPLYAFSEQPMKVVKVAFLGMSFPINLVIATLLGTLLTFMPSFFQTPRILEDIIHLSGLLTITFSILAMGEPLRTARFFNFLFGGAVLAAAPMLGDSIASNSILMLIATGIIFASFYKGKVYQRFGTWDKLVR